MDRTEKINHLDWLLDNGKIAPINLKPLYIECNTIDMESDIALYRIMSFDRLIESLKSQSLSMTKPKIWDDPYETFLMNYKARMKDGTIVGFQPIREKIFCQCWSLREECEGLWKARTNNIDRKDNDYKFVKIKICATKLMDYFYDTNNIFHYLTYFIGRVSYVDEKIIQDILKDGLGSYFTSYTYMAIIHSLLIKRRAFEYEDEVRLIFNAPDKDGIDYSSVTNKWDLTKDFFSFKIDINDVIEEITFHPYLKDEDCSNFEKEIRALGFKRGICHSNLYTKEDIIYDF